MDDVFRRSLAAAAEQGKYLRIRLHVDAELDPVPWEYLYDPRLDRFLSLSQETPVQQAELRAVAAPVEDAADWRTDEVLVLTTRQGE